MSTSLVHRVELGLRLGLDVGEARVAVERAHRLELLDELGAVEVVAGLRADHLAQRAPAAERLDLLALVVALVDLELADLVARAPRGWTSVMSMPSRSGVSITRGVPICTLR